VTDVLHACLVKPLDMEEVVSWLETVTENLSETEPITGREVG